MPRRKMGPRSKNPKYQVKRLEDPNLKGSHENNDLVSILLFDGCCMSFLLDDSERFATEEEERETWLVNRELLMSLTTENPRDTAYKILVGNRPWVFWKYETDIDRAILEDSDYFSTHHLEEWQYEWLKEHGRLHEGEEEAVGRLRARIAEEERRMFPNRDLPEDTE
ncbi:MAG TPA: hypothetical protein VMX75_07750 [Spirochaetia bacterium]|nr:hypothetical protein [Spirochaetia bacterium]